MNPPSQPPRFVPTLTEVVISNDAPAAAPLQSGSGDTTEAQKPPVDVFAAAAAAKQLEEAMIQRVLQRVDVMLDRRLREAVGEIILEHTEALAPRLRLEIEAVVRQSLSQAFALEIGDERT
jgi:hypothetical protein